MTRSLHKTARIQQAANDALAMRPVREPIDWDALNRLSAYAAERRAEMGEAKYLELTKEWNA